MSEDSPAGRPGMAMTAKSEMAMTADADFTTLDDSALFGRRAEMRAELERLPPESPAHAALTALYDESTHEIDARATRAWARAGKAIQ
jgi:hypothetical protein